MNKLFLMIFLSFTMITELSSVVASASKPPTEENSVSYYSTLKLLRARAFRENQKLGPVFFGPHQTIWQKIKRELVDKELRRTAFIKGGELVVSHAVLDDLETKVSAKTKELVAAQGKKQDRMISVGYAESRIRDMLRRAGYRDAKEIKTVMRDVEKSVKRTIGKNKRIALSKLEELTLAAMKRHKENDKSYANKDLSRLGAEVKMLKAIKKKKLTAAQEITAINKMTDALNKQKTRRFSTEVVDSIIERVFNTIEHKKQSPAIKKKTSKPRKKSSLRRKANPVTTGKKVLPTATTPKAAKKSSAKKQRTSSAKKHEQKRGKSASRGRWGHEKRPYATKTTLE